MAGSEELAIYTHSELENSTLTSHITAVINEWQVRFGRFISYHPSEFTSTHPSLAPRTRKHGVWMSTASASASVKLIYARSANGLDDAILVLSLRSEILEEHYISKMHFSWPQTSCNHGYPARGTRAILVSYKDGVDHLQRFSLQFLTNYEAENFLNIVKEILKNGSPQLLQSYEFNSEVSSQTEAICSYRPAYKPKGEWPNTTSENNSNQLMHPSSELTEYTYKPKGEWQHTTSQDNSNQLMHPSTELTEYTYEPKGEWQHTTSEDSSNQLMHPHSELTEYAYKPKGELQHTTSEDNSNLLMHPSSELTEYSVSVEGIKDHEGAEAMSAFPPSFTEMMKNCNPAVAEAKLTESGDLTSQFVQYLEGTTFKELLDTVENVISQLGDDMVL